MKLNVLQLLGTISFLKSNVNYKLDRQGKFLNCPTLLYLSCKLYQRDLKKTKVIIGFIYLPG